MFMARSIENYEEAISTVWILMNGRMKSRSIPREDTPSTLAVPAAATLLGTKGIREFYREACLADLLGICCGETYELCPKIVNDEQVAVRPVVVAQPEIGADGLRVRRIHLKSAAERQKTRE